MRQTEKTVEVQGRKFKIKAFDAMTGSYIAFTLFEKMLPAGMEGKILTQMGRDSSPLPQGRQLMSKQEFFDFQKDCLSVVSEVLKGRDAPVIESNGHWGVPDIENNTVLVLTLTLHALAFNVADFFGGDGLKELLSSVRDLIPSNMPMSTDGSTPQ